MVVLIVLLTVVVFFIVDLVLRLVLRKVQDAKLRRERAEALDVGLRLEFAEEATSLKRVEVPTPKARILAVDDESVILDSFRKILVLEGFSVDTVATGQEALAMVRKREYDFVFTDLKMPGMNGVDVTKAVKHLRPDIDVVVITGYATIESAVETMKFGAMDYVQKPFTEDELVGFAKKLLHRREDRIERSAAPEIHLVTPKSGESRSPKVINVPGGIYVAPEHTWVRVEMNGVARIGLDDFAHKTIGPFDEVDSPEIGAKVQQGDVLFAVQKGGRTLSFHSPISGEVSKVNHDLEYHLDLLQVKPYDFGWICAVIPSSLSGDLAKLRIGADSKEWYETEVRNYRQALKGVADDGEDRSTGKEDGKGTDEISSASQWDAFKTTFLLSDAR